MNSEELIKTMKEAESKNLGIVLGNICDFVIGEVFSIEQVNEILDFLLNYNIEKSPFDLKEEILYAIYQIVFYYPIKYDERFSCLNNIKDNIEDNLKEYIDDIIESLNLNSN